MNGETQTLQGTGLGMLGVGVKRWLQLGITVLGLQIKLHCICTASPEPQMKEGVVNCTWLATYKLGQIFVGSSL